MTLLVAGQTPGPTVSPDGGTPFKIPTPGSTPNAPDFDLAAQLGRVRLTAWIFDPWVPYVLAAIGLVWLFVLLAAVAKVVATTRRLRVFREGDDARAKEQNGKVANAWVVLILEALVFAFMIALFSYLQNA